MKLSLYPAPGVAPSATSESLALGAWYDRHAVVRRMWAIRSAGALRVIVSLEPTIDNSDTFPTWFANSDQWIRELQCCAEGDIELQLIDEPLAEEFETDVEGDIVVAMSWRDPTFA
jgi:hypothetical protein